MKLRRKVLSLTATAVAVCALAACAADDAETPTVTKNAAEPSPTATRSIDFDKPMAPQIKPLLKDRFPDISQEDAKCVAGVVGDSGLTEGAQVMLLEGLAEGKQLSSAALGLSDLEALLSPTLGEQLAECLPVGEPPRVNRDYSGEVSDVALRKVLDYVVGGGRAVSPDGGTCYADMLRDSGISEKGLNFLIQLDLDTLDLPAQLAAGVKAGTVTEADRDILTDPAVFAGFTLCDQALADDPERTYDEILAGAGVQDLHELVGTSQGGKD